MFRVIALLFALLPALAYADDKPGNATAPPPPPIVNDDGQNDGQSAAEQIQPDVTIKRDDDNVIEEYRINGRLYMVRIFPKLGKPYYLLYPEDGSDPSRYPLDDSPTYWKLFSW